MGKKIVEPAGICVPSLRVRVVFASRWKVTIECEHAMTMHWNLIEKSQDLRVRWPAWRRVSLMKLSVFSNLYMLSIVQSPPVSSKVFLNSSRSMSA